MCMDISNVYDMIFIYFYLIQEKLYCSTLLSTKVYFTTIYLSLSSIQLSYSLGPITRPLLALFILVVRDKKELAKYNKFVYFENEKFLPHPLARYYEFT